MGISAVNESVGAAMLSRVADSVYWMARYVERAENLARLLLSTQNLLLDAGAEGSDEAQFWGPILATTRDVSGGPREGRGGVFGDASG
jgi:uncharacterized alpha-E superfamily protein